MVSNKKSKVDLVEIDAARINDVCDNYFKWKSLNDFFVVVVLIFRIQYLNLLDVFVWIIFGTKVVVAMQ